MRRKDREVTEPSEMLKVLEKCEVCRLGFAESDGVYIVPLNFGYDYSNDSFTLYFHGATIGKKAKLLESSPDVGFETDIPVMLIEGNTACKYSYMYQSIIGRGKAEVISEAVEKTEAMRRIMQKYSKKDDLEFDEKIFEKTMLFKVTVREWSCKAHL